ncbi:MAG: hypothetical protein AB7P49_02640 [Bdellovibrionales bacterium]
MIGNEKLIEGQRVLNRLESIYTKERFPIVGVEYSQELFRTLFQDPATGKDLSVEILPSFSQLCPKHLKAFKDISLVFPGPEVEFVRRHKGKLRLMPLGNEELTQMALSGLSQETRDFPQKIDQLSKEARVAYEKFSGHVLKGEALSSTNIAALISNLKEPEKAKVRKYMNEANSSILKNLDPMNEKILEKALATRENLVLVIGNSHVHGLRRQLEKQCTVEGESLAK